MNVTTWTDFERWIEQDNHLSALAQLLWHKLLYRFNVCAWRKEWVSVDNIRLMGMIHTSEKTLLKVRQELIYANLIDYKKGRKGKPGKYKLLQIPLIRGVICTVDIPVQTTVQTEVQTEVQSADIDIPRPIVDDDDDHLLREREEKKAVSEIQRLYLGLLGEYITPSQISKILVFYRYGLSLEVIASAFDRGSLYADRSKFAYILGCLERWHSAGIKTIDELTDDDYRFDVATGRLE